MESAEYVRPSRDGDQFHYVWASRRSLRLLDPLGRMVMLAVEGTSDADTNSPRGEEVIDLAEYYGSTDLSAAEQVIYRQFKHSTVDRDREWTKSWMKKTVVGFARKYAAIRVEHPSAVMRTTYVLTTNRAAKPEVHHALEAIRRDARGPERKVADAIRYLSRLVAPIVGEDQVADFFRLFAIEDTEDGLIDQRDQLKRQVIGFLPGAPADDYVLLKEMIGVRATSEYSARPFVTRHDVLAALKVTEDQLLPAPNLFSSPEHVIETQQFKALAEFVTRYEGPSAVIAHATGGVGKNVLAHGFGSHMPSGSIIVVYDCFGSGSYRRPSEPQTRGSTRADPDLQRVGGEGLVRPRTAIGDSRRVRLLPHLQRAG